MQPMDKIFRIQAFERLIYSALVWWTALLTFLGLAILSIIGFSEAWFIRRADPLLNVSTVDYRTLVSQRVLDLRGDPPASPQVILFGRSSAHASVRSEESMNLRLAETGARFHLFAHPGQTLAQVRACISELNGLDNIVYILTINPLYPSREYTRLSGNYYIEDPYAFRSSAVDSLLSLQGAFVPPRIGSFFVDNIYYFAPRLLSMIQTPAGRPFSLQKENVFLGRGNSYDNYLKLYAPRDSSEIVMNPEFPTLLRESADTYLDLARMAVDNGQRIVFLVGPLNPDWIIDVLGPETIARFRELNVQPLLDAGYDVYDLNELARFAPGEFRDRSHLSAAEANDRSEQQIVGIIGEVLSDREESR
jgi:hypothetical protein